MNMTLHLETLHLETLHLEALHLETERRSDRGSGSRQIGISAGSGFSVENRASAGKGLVAGTAAAAYACATNAITPEHPWAMFATKKVHGRRPTEYSP